MTEQDKIEELKNRILTPKNNKGIFFSRVPLKEWEWFTNWANAGFEGDYGMALKWLIQGYMPPDETLIAQKVEELESRIKELELQSLLSQQVSDKKTGIKLLNGKILGKQEE